MKLGKAAIERANLAVNEAEYNQKIADEEAKLKKVPSGKNGDLRRARINAKIIGLRSERLEIRKKMNPSKYRKKK